MVIKLFKINYHKPIMFGDLKRVLITNHTLSNLDTMEGYKHHILEDLRKCVGLCE